MNKTTSEDRDEIRHLRQTVSEAMALLGDAGKQLQAIRQEEAIMVETPIEAQDAIESAAVDSAPGPALQILTSSSAP